MKKCPYCAEEIQDEAIKCRFCNELLKKKNKWLNCLFNCLLAFFISIVLFILLIYLSFWMVKFIVYKTFFAGPSPNYHPPFTGQGVEGVVREFAEIFGALWGKIKDFLHIGTQNYKITF